MMGGNPPLDDLTISDDSLKSGEKTKPMIDQEGKEKHQEDEDNAALEAAMKHAHELGTHQGITRAMVIRAYPSKLFRCIVWNSGYKNNCNTLASPCLDRAMAYFRGYVSRY
jgi:hypothetical protein